MKTYCILVRESSCGGFYAAIRKRTIRHYGKHTAFGARSVMQWQHLVDLGRFRTKEVALGAANEALAKHYPVNPDFKKPESAITLAKGSPTCKQD